MNYLGNHGDLLMKANLSSVSNENATSKEKEMNFLRQTLSSSESSHYYLIIVFKHINVFEKFAEKTLQKHLLCISSELLLYMYF